MGASPIGHPLEYLERLRMKCKKDGCNNDARVSRNKGKVALFCSQSCAVKSAVNTLRRSRKRTIVDMFGGGCSICGYSKCLAALQFHHTDPTQKDIGLSRAVTLSMDKIENELSKCILLCANCHAEEHWLKYESQDLP